METGASNYFAQLGKSSFSCCEMDSAEPSVPILDYFIDLAKARNVESSAFYVSDPKFTSYKSGLDSTDLPFPILDYFVDLEKVRLASNAYEPGAEDDGIPSQSESWETNDLPEPVSDYFSDSETGIQSAQSSSQSSESGGVFEAEELPVPILEYFQDLAKGRIGSSVSEPDFETHEISEHSSEFEVVFDSAGLPVPILDYFVDMETTRLASNILESLPQNVIEVPEHLPVSDVPSVPIIDYFVELERTRLSSNIYESKIIEPDSCVNVIESEELPIMDCFIDLVEGRILSCVSEPKLETHEISEPSSEFEIVLDSAGLPVPILDYFVDMERARLASNVIESVPQNVIKEPELLSVSDVPSVPIIDYFMELERTRLASNRLEPVAEQEENAAAHIPILTKSRSVSSSSLSLISESEVESTDYFGSDDQSSDLGLCACGSSKKSSIPILDYFIGLAKSRQSSSSDLSSSGYESESSEEETKFNADQKAVLMDIKCILQSHKKPRPIGSLFREYYEVIGRYLKHQGFACLEDFLRASGMFKFSASNGQIFVSPNLTEKSFHIVQMVQTQKKPQEKARFSKNNKRTSSSGYKQSRK